VTEERFNGLMASFNREQSERQRVESEVSRLQGLLTTAVADGAALREQIAGLTAGQTDAVGAAERRATEAASTVAELTQQVTKLTADATRLQFLVDHPDISAFAAVLPSTTDRAVLDQVATTIRTARDADTSRIRDHVAGNGNRGGGGPPRVTGTQMSPAAVKAYLAEAVSSGIPGEFEKRLAEVTATK
jgi:hypothetical protein